MWKGLQKHGAASGWIIRHFPSSTRLVWTASFCWHCSLLHTHGIWISLSLAYTTAISHFIAAWEAPDPTGSTASYGCSCVARCQSPMTSTLEAWSTFDPRYLAHCYSIKRMRFYGNCISNLSPNLTIQLHDIPKNICEWSLKLHYKNIMLLWWFSCRCSVVTIAAR